MRLYNRFWGGVTITLSVIFAVLFFPIAFKQYGVASAVVLTAVGLAVIWLVYFVRAQIFSKMGSNRRVGN